jgi:hypothetical protein
MTLVRSLPLPATLVALFACSSGGDGGGGGMDARPVQQDAAAPQDSGAMPDSGVAEDTGPAPDSGRPDSGMPDSVRRPDAGRDAPIVLAFSAVPNTALDGQQVDIVWNIRNADNITINADPPFPAGNPFVPTTTMLMGMMRTPPIHGNVGFTLVAVKGMETTMGLTGVLFDPGPPQILTWGANPNPGRVGSTTTLSWTTRNATHVRVTQGARLLFCSPVRTTDCDIPTPGMVASGMFTSPPLMSGLNSFTLEATNDFPNRMFSMQLNVTGN